MDYLILCLLITFQFVSIYFHDLSFGLWGGLVGVPHLFASIIIVLYFGCIYFYLVFRRKVRLIGVEKIFWIFFFPYLCSIIFSPSARALSSLTLYACPFLFFFLVLRLDSKRKLPKKNYLIYILLISVILSLTVLTDPMELLGSGGYRFSSIFPGEGATTSYFYAIISMLFLCFYYLKRKMIYLGYFFFSALFCFFGQSRVFIYSLFIITILFFVIYRSKKKLLLSVVLAMTIMLPSMYFFTSQSPVYNRVFGIFTEVSNLSKNTYNYREYSQELGSLYVRLGLWDLVVHQLKDPAYILQGHGVGSSAFFSEDYFGIKSHFHNDILTLLYERGIFGLFGHYLVILLILRLVFDSWEKKRRIIALVFLFEIIIGLANTNIFTMYPRVIFFYGLAILRNDGQILLKNGDST